MTELLDIVNERDELTGEVIARKQVRDQITRNVVVLLQDQRDRHILQIRAQHVGWPGCYDFAACGAVKSGEDYRTAGARELGEELGIGCPLDFLGKRYRELVYPDRIRRLFTGFLRGRYEGEVMPSREVADVRKVTTEELERLIAGKERRIESYFVDEWEIAKGFGIGSIDSK